MKRITAIARQPDDAHDTVARNAETPASRSCVLILGMHRSGTSALTRLLSIAGLTLPRHLLGPASGNEQGHWEPEPLMRYHDQLLEELGSAWSDWRTLDIDQLPITRRREIGEDIRRLVAREFEQADLFVLKEPRLCRFADFFIDALAAANITCKPVLAFRNPLEVCDSLARRDGMLRTEAALLWLRHLLDAEKATRQKDRVFINYHDVLDNWPDRIDAIARHLDIEMHPPGDIALQVDRFLSPRLRHHAYSTEQVVLDPVLRNWIAPAYEAFLILANNPESGKALRTLDRIRREFNQATPILRALVSDLGDRHQASLTELQAARQRDAARTEDLQRTLEQKDRENGELRARLAELDNLVRQQKDELRRAKSAIPEITRLRDEISEWRSRLSQARVNHNALETTIESRNHAIAELRAELADMTERLDAARQAAASQRQALEAARQRIGELERRQDDQSLELKQTRVLLTQAESRLETYKTSTSWRITAPLRAIKIRSGKLLRGRQRISEDIGVWPHKSGNGEPQVSVIVPNYNHARFLPRRLESIYHQRGNIAFEVILLDDASTDGSQEILRRYADQYADITRLQINPENSGSPFAQWARGIRMAKAPVIWIAESDDFCDLDFLAKMAAPFERDESLALAYCDIQFADENDVILHGLDDYRRSTGFDCWSAARTVTAHEEFNGPFAIRNIVPNVSGALFRKPHLDDDFIQYLSTFRICGDWIFYMRVARGGTIGYVPTTRSYFRQHKSNTSVSMLETKRYYREHQSVASQLRRCYGTDPALISRNQRALKATWRHHVETLKNPFPLESCYDINQVLATPREHLNILIGSLGFYLGGGELFPIHLANALYRAGHAVTFFALGYDEPENPSIRKLLDPGIPVVRKRDFAANPGLLKALGIEVINAHNIGVEYFFLDPRYRLSETRCAYIVSHHGSYEVSEASGADLRRIDDMVDQWLFLTEKNLGKLKAAGVDLGNARKIHNGLPVPAVRPDISRASLGIPDDAFVCAIITRALPEKGWRQAIEAVERINRADPETPVHLLLVGDGPVYEELRKRNLPDYITLTGFKKHAASYYHIADAGLMPSYFVGESFPLTTIECLLAGKPFIATDVGEIRNMLTDRDGGIGGAILPRHGDDAELVESISQALLDFSTDPQRYESARNTAVRLASGYRIDEVAGVYVKIFAGLLANPDFSRETRVNPGTTDTDSRPAPHC